MTVTPFVPPYLPTKDTYKPTHPDLFLIRFGDEGDYTSSLIAQKDFEVGQVICHIQGTIPGRKAYSSVQVMPDPPVPGQDLDKPRHIELCSDLLYVNHSCDPNVAFEIGKENWVVRVLRPIKKGDIMTFAYFSTEWSMDQPFDCLCGTQKCLGTIRGAKYIDQSVLSKYFVNHHIKQQLEQQKASQ